MLDETYNGWTNRETWATALHIDNNEWSHDRRNNACSHALSDAIATEYLSRDQVAQHRLEDTLKDWIESEFEMVYHQPNHANPDMRMMACDVGSLWRVNWREIAANWLEDFEQAA